MSDKIMTTLASATGGKSYRAHKYGLDHAERPFIDYGEDSIIWERTAETDKTIRRYVPLADLSRKLAARNEQLLTYFLDGSRRVFKVDDIAYCDVLFGGTESAYFAYMDQFQEYVSPNDEFMLDGHHCYQNKLTPINTDSNLIMWDNDLIGDIQVAGYEDLLQPELKGKIALPDPASSGTGSGTICDFVWLFGDEDWNSEAGWDFVSKFVDQLDGKVSPSSGNAHKSVADGENTITVTYEGAAFAYLKNGANVSIIYPAEGVVASNAMTAIVKDCEHPDAAKAFVDFVTSKEVQDLFGTVLLSRPVRADAELADFIPAASTITYFERSQEEVSAHTGEVIEHFNEIFADAQG